MECHISESLIIKTANRMNSSFVKRITVRVSYIFYAFSCNSAITGNADRLICNNIGMLVNDL